MAEKVTKPNIVKMKEKITETREVEMGMVSEVTEEIHHIDQNPKIVIIAISQDITLKIVLNQEKIVIEKEIHLEIDKGIEEVTEIEMVETEIEIQVIGMGEIITVAVNLDKNPDLTDAIIVLKRDT